MQPDTTVGSSEQRGSLPRSHLVAALLQRPRRLRLLCAPAGYGKTWLIDRALAAGVATPQHEVRLNLSGGTVSLPGLCVRMAQALGCADASPQSVFTYLERLDGPIRLVLDDYPSAASAEMDAWLDQLLLHATADIQLWVTCRQRPAWNLPRLQLAGELLILESPELTLSRSEFDALAEQLAPQLPESRRQQIWQQTLGWCAGACLLITSPQRSDVLLRDYLGRELLAGLSDEESRVLIGLAHLPRISASLSAQLWEDLGGGSIFLRLLSSQSFFQPLSADGSWYRILPAVAQVLRKDQNPERFVRLRLSACRILGNHGFVDEAVELALEAGNPDVAVNYLAQLTPAWLLAASNLRTVLGWRSRLPARLLCSTPRLVIMNACALLMSSRLEEAQTALTRLGNFFPQPNEMQSRRLLAVWQTVHGAIQARLGNACAEDHCAAAVTQLGADQRHLAFVSHMTLARIAITKGEGADAQRTLMNALELARRQGCISSEVMINGERICLLALCGDVRQAEQLLHESLALLREEGGDHSMLTARLLVIQGKLHLRRKSLELAESAMREALGLVSDYGTPPLHALVGLSEVHSCRGDFSAALRFLQDAERRMQCANVPEPIYRGVILLQTLSILVQQKSWAAALSLGRQLEEYLRGATGRMANLQMPSLPVRSQLLLAEAEQGSGRVKDAERRLQTVLRECQRLNFRGLAGKARQALKHVQNGAGSTPDAAASGEAFSVLDTAGVVAHKPGPARSNKRQHEDLTPREISVLELLAEGFSNNEIGERLFISTNTVKAHLKHISGKLGVARRAQAVARARAIGVLA